MRHEMSFAPPKTRKARRSVALDPATVAALRGLRRHQAEERIAAGPLYEDLDLMFCREDGRPIHPDAFSKAFVRHVAEAGLPRIRLHDLRHKHATLALQSGAHPKVVSERLGHASISITLDVYSHAIPSLQEDLADTLAAAVLGGR